ncbi:MAG TPA: DUF4097 family beta strand repeat-containing protein [Acidimicrobiales bacterium]|nr:DUF4097 family beta strand repeat-containing protein [Acidimicrobiales bacterium]
MVQNGVGLVSITARPGATTEVSLEAHTEGADELIERAVVECRPAGDRQVLVVKVPQRHGMKFSRRNAVTVRIETPPGTDIDISTASADIELNGSLGEANVKTANGDLNADEIDGDLLVKTASGDFSIDTVKGNLHMQSASGDIRAGRVGGRTSCSTASGDVEVGSAAGRVEVRSSSGDVRLGHVVGDVKIVGVSGDVRVLSYASGNLQVRAVSADITIGIAPGVTFGIDAESMSGTVRSDIPLNDSPGGRGGPPQVVIGARSVSGDVLVERAVEAFAT